MSQVGTSLLVLAILASVVAGHSARAESQDSLSLEWTGPAYRLTTATGPNGHIYTRIKVEGWDNVGWPGKPALPRRGHLVALPPSGDFGLEVLEVVYDSVRLDHPVEPASPSAHLPLQQAQDKATDVASPTNDWLVLGEAAWMREHRLASLTFTPFRYDPDRQTLDVLQRVRFRVWWEREDERRTTDDKGRMTTVDLLRPLVLNPDDLATFRAFEPTVDQSYRPAAFPFTHNILVASEGLYALDYATLSAAGVPVGSVDPDTLQLFHDEAEVATQWEGDGDASFESGERLLFYARPELTRYAGHDVYGLAWGAQDGQRMTSRSGDPTGLPTGTAWATVLAAENAEYVSLYPDHRGDRWFWRQLKLPDVTESDFTVALDTPVSGTAGQLVVRLQGSTFSYQDPDHRVRFHVNGVHVGDKEWDGATAYTAALSLPADVLNSGNNTVTLSLPGDTGAFGEAAWVDAITVTYGLDAVSGDAARFRGEAVASAYAVGGFSATPRAYDVSDPHAPQSVNGFGYSGGGVTVGDGGGTPAEYLLLTDAQIRTPQAVVPVKTLDDPSAGADYIVLTHPDFEAELAPLVSHRLGQGLRVAVVDVEAVYDQFGDGRMDPAAIHAFLSHAYANWTAPPLTYVLLVGDGTYDPRGYKVDSNPTYLPPYLVDADPWLGEVGSDNRYADLTGDPLPELRVGRMPVNTSEEAAAVVEKIIQYETDPLPGDWNARLLFGADDRSTAGDHHADADSEYLTYATPAYNRVGARVYLTATVAPDVSVAVPPFYDDAATAQGALVGELSRGALLYTYFGHASWHQEAVLESDDWAPLFHLDHIPRLTNTRRWPLVLHMTCYTGRYFEPVGDTLDESLLRAEDVGAVAVWGPSGNGVATGHRTLHKGFYQAVFDDGQTELGAATHAALAGLYATGFHGDLIETYHLFGDPALALNLTIIDWPVSVFLPIIAHSAP